MCPHLYNYNKKKSIMCDIIFLIPCYSFFGCTHTSHNRTEALEHSALHITFYLCISLCHLTLGHALDRCYHHTVRRYISSIITYTTCSN